MSKILKRVFATTIYFVSWIVLYMLFYIVAYYSEEVLLLPQFKLSHKFAVAFIAFIKYLPALEISAILILFSISSSRRSVFQLRRHSGVVINLITKLFFMCIIASFINITMSEIVQPMLVDTKKNAEILSQRYYENINSASLAMEKEDYETAEQYINMALLIWEDNQQALFLKERIAGLTTNNVKRFSEIQNIAVSRFITIPESLDAKEILSMANTRIKMLDFYTANYYLNLVLQIAKDDEDLKEEALVLRKLCVEKLDSGFSNEEMLKTQKEFEAKKSAYDALIQEDYSKAYYSFLKLHNDLLNNENKYDPDVEKYLAIAKHELSEQAFFIEDLDNIKSFNSSYPVQFTLKSKNAHFSIGGFYFHSVKDHFDIHLSNVLYSTYKDDGSFVSQTKFPYAKIIEKKVDGESRLYMLVSAISKNVQSKEPFIPPIDLEMKLEDFNLILLAQRGTHAMTIVDLCRFIPVANCYGFDSYMYQTELSMRFADFFLFIIFTIYGAIVSFNLCPRNLTRCTMLLVIACLIFPYPTYILLEILRHVFKLFMTLVVNTGFIFSNTIALVFLLFTLIIAMYFLYNIGYDEELKNR